MNILITAGPTREYLDPVRYISNESSGKMGFALAQAARELGGEVTLIAGPVGLPTPKGVTRIDVVSCDEMRKHVIRHAKKADVIIMAAAVADMRPKRPAKHKLKKPIRSISLVQNPDILHELCTKKKSGQIIVGFALETESPAKHAQKKLHAKGCDWIVANDTQALGADASKATLIPRAGRKISLPKLPKHDLAIVLLSHILA